MLFVFCRVADTRGVVAVFLRAVAAVTWLALARRESEWSGFFFWSTCMGEQFVVRRKEEEDEGENLRGP